MQLPSRIKMSTIAGFFGIVVILFVVFSWHFSSSEKHLNPSPSVEVGPLESSSSLPTRSVPTRPVINNGSDSSDLEDILQTGNVDNRAKAFNRLLSSISDPKSIDVPRLLTAIDTNIDGQQRIEAKLYLGRTLLRLSALDKPSSFFEMLSEGDERATIMQSMAGGLDKKQSDDAVSWAIRNILPEESFRVFTGLAGSACSPDLLKQALSSPIVSQNERSSMARTAVRAAAIRGEAMTWLSTFLENNPIKDQGDIVANYLASSPKFTEPSDVSFIHGLPISETDKNTAIRSLGGFHARAKGGKLGIEWGSALTGPDKLNYSKGLFSAWAASDLNGLSSKIAEIRDSELKQTAINSLVTQLDAVGEHAAATQWRQFGSQ